MFRPDPFSGRSVDDLAVWMEIQFQKLANEFTEFEIESIRFKIFHTEPENPSEGHLYYADGSDWNPGYGRGLYLYTTGWEPLVNVLSENKISAAKLTLTSFAPTFTNA